MKNYLSSIFIKKTHFFLSFFLFIIFIISFVLEKFFNFQPCILCSVERWIFFALSASLLFVHSLRKNKKIFLITVNIATSFAGFTTAIYHKFVQNGLASCSFMQQHSQQTFENFQENLQNTIPCGVKSSLFGVELVWFNIVIFGIIFLILLFSKKT
jgi:disulfide bond formation protein DsbB